MIFQHQSEFWALVLLNVVWNSFAQSDLTSTPDFYEKYSVRTDEPVDEAESYYDEMDNAIKAFWIVLYMTMVMLMLLVGVTIFWQRHRLIELYQRRVVLWKGKVDLETKKPLQGPNNPMTV
ncbi:hypothetical protein ACJMK2_009736 [Sinanodonta woodiana]|uniref:Uncharacterized protein n=1 Tax=Sinanodonta woodiana TaxID=1069815 RepID=A0ABD3VD52_SINWO